MPVLLYGIETCLLIKPDFRSLDFVTNRLFMELLKTNNMDTIRQCQQFFSFQFWIA